MRTPDSVLAFASDQSPDDAISAEQDTISGSPWLNLRIEK